MYRLWGKRLLDLGIVILSAVYWLPLLLVVAAGVRILLGRPVLFRQLRPGMHGWPFELRKLRTMLETRDENGKLLPDEQRRTKFGDWLRATSLDELPELLHVLVGQMSLVGPRPLLMRYLDRFTQEQARRHEVRPGLTGWAQVNGRNAISWEEKFTLDVWYVDNISAMLDLKILWRTVMRVLMRQGVTSQDHVTMEEFMGREDD